MRKTKSRVLEGLWLVVGLRRGPQTFSCNRDHYLHQIRPVARLPGVPMSSCDAGSPGPVFAVDRFLPPFIITLVIIWSCLCTIWRLQEDVRGVSEMVKPVFGGRRRYQRTKSHSAKNIHWTCPNREDGCCLTDNVCVLGHVWSLNSKDFENVSVQEWI